MLYKETEATTAHKISVLCLFLASTHEKEHSVCVFLCFTYFANYAFPISIYFSINCTDILPSLYLSTLLLLSMINNETILLVCSMDNLLE